MNHVDLRPDDYRPAPPPADIARRYGIAIVGCGSIARLAHLPAYRTCGYRVVATCDIVADNARAAATDFAIPFWTTQIDEAGITLMINQQARWAPAHRALRVLLDRDVLGHLYSVLHVNRAFQDQPGSWFVALEHFNIVDHGIHYIDLARYFTGQTPRRIKATTTMVPGQSAVSPMIYTILCEYAPEAHLMTTLHFNNIVQTSALHRYEWFLDGTRGSACVSQTELSVSCRDRPDQRQVIALQGHWFPDAFGGSMGEMLRALAEGREPATSGRENLDTLCIAYAAVESSVTGRTVELQQ